MFAVASISHVNLKAIYASTITPCVPMYSEAKEALNLICEQFEEWESSLPIETVACLHFDYCDVFWEWLNNAETSGFRDVDELHQLLRNETDEYWREAWFESHFVSMDDAKDFENSPFTGVYHMISECVDYVIDKLENADMYEDYDGSW